MSSSPLSLDPLLTRRDLAHAATLLLDSLALFTSPGGARIKLGNTGTHYDEVAAQLEGFSRPLWGLVPLLLGGGAEGGAESYAGAHRWVQGLANGTDPSHPEYWGPTRDKDQRMVEMCAIGWALAVLPEVFWNPLDERQKENVARWLGKVNECEMPKSECVCAFGLVDDRLGFCGGSNFFFFFFLSLFWLLLQPTGAGSA